MTLDFNSTQTQEFVQSLISKQAELVAIKKYYPNLDPRHFVGLKQRLRKVNHLQHPNLVETIAAFLSKSSSTTEISWNFVSPLALCDLQQLFHNRSWGGPIPAATQFEALASALAYLHETLKFAHRSIRPSNILVYQGSGYSELILKLASFSTSADLSQEFELIEQSKVDAAQVWILDLIFANDVMTLGCVFVELVAFMVEGRQGVVEFRRSIATDESRVSRDALYSEYVAGMMHPTMVVKPQVCTWMAQFSESSPFAQVAFPIIEKMLDDSPHKRLTARQVCEAFMKVKNLQR